MNKTTTNFYEEKKKRTLPPISAKRNPSEDKNSYFETSQKNELKQLINENENENHDKKESLTDKIIINGPEGTILHVAQESLGAGEYSFASLPAGDFYIRFIYGDNLRTVLANETDDTKIQLGDSEGNVKDYKLGELQAQVNGIVGTKGMNKKSYNGQDYKSTVYQSGINQNPLIVNGQQLDNYHGITRYTDVNGKNYINTIDNATENRPSDNYSVANIWNLSGKMNVNRC